MREYLSWSVEISCHNWGSGFTDTEPAGHRSEINPGFLSYPAQGYTPFQMQLQQMKSPQCDLARRFR